MAGLRRTAAATFLVATVAACASGPTPAASSRERRWEEAYVEAAAGGFPILVRRGDVRAVVTVAPLPVLSGLDSGRRLRPGDRVRYRVLRAERDALVADRVELLPPLASDPERMSRLTDLGDDPASGGAVPVDVRAADEFAAGHLAGARSLPADGGWSVWRRLGVPKATPLLFYGADEFAPEPFEAARAALGEGYGEVRVLQGGLRSWIQDGRPTFVSPASLLGKGSQAVALLDLRPRAELEAGAIPGSVSMPATELRHEPLSGRPYWPNLVLIGRDERDAAVPEALSRIRKWRSFDEIEKGQPIQILEGGYAGWIASGGPRGDLASLAELQRLGRFGDPEVLELEEFRAAWRAGGGAGFLLDVRPGMRAGDVPSFAKNVPLGELTGRLAELPRDREIWIYCGSGRRAAVAREILVRAGFRARYLKDYAPTR